MPLLAQTPAQVILIVVVVVGIIFGLIVLAVFTRYFRFWIQSKTTGAGIGIFDLLGHDLPQGQPGGDRPQQDHGRAGRPGPTESITTRALEAHYLAGGNVPLVIRSIIAARKAKIDLSFKLATAIDLAGRNVLEAVQTSVYPKVIDCPPRNLGRPTLDGVARNGIQLKVKARVTVRANLNQLIGGATEETIVARVGEGIVSAIGSAETHSEVLASPDRISKKVLARKLDSQTAFEIVSIDIADIDVGDNIGARLQADQAEADLRVFRANAENKRAMAVANEQENIAMIEENRAKVVEAESEVPKAIAEAFRDRQAGHHGLLQAQERPGRYRDAHLDRQDHRRRQSAREPPHDPSLGKRGQSPFVRNGPKGASHKWGLSPFPARPFLLADIGDVFGVLLVIVVIVVTVVGKLISWVQAISAAEAQKARQRAQNAPRRAPLDDEIGEFLRKAAQRRGGGRGDGPAAPARLAAAAEGPAGRARGHHPDRRVATAVQAVGVGTGDPGPGGRRHGGPSPPGLRPRTGTALQPPASRRPRQLADLRQRGTIAGRRPGPRSQRTGGPAGQRRGDAPGDRAQ